MDATHVPIETIREQIPQVYKICLSRGIDITKTPLEVAPGSHTWLGGLKIDTEGRTPVPGLWAAGETAGGIHGGNRIGGSALSSALVFGRLAGRAASAEAKGQARPVPTPSLRIPEEDADWIRRMLERASGPRQADVRLGCRLVATDELGPIRDAEGLRRSLAEFDEIENEKLPRMCLDPEAQSSGKVRGRELESALSIRNLTLLGKLLATAALHREESRGAHYRMDFPETDDSRWRAVTRLQQTPEGGIALHEDPLKIR